MSKSLRDLIFGIYVTALGGFLAVLLGGSSVIVTFGIMMIGFTICVIGWRRPN